MQSKTNSGFRRLAACCVAAFVVFFVSSTAFASTKAYTKGMKALKKGDYTAAEKIFREILGKDARDTEARLGLSFSLFKQRDLQGAYDNAARVIMLDPLSARAHAILGASILGAGEFRLSVEEFRTAISLNDGEALAISGLALVDFYENRLGAALAGLRKAVSIDPDEPDYLFNLGQAAARNEKYKEAADAYERFLFIAPKTDVDRRARIVGLIDFLRYLGKQGSLYVPSAGVRTTVPFESFDNRPILSVRINGEKQPFKFVLDTGSGMSVLSEQTAKKLGLKPVARGGMARAVGGGGKFEIVYGYVNSIEMKERSLVTRSQRGRKLLSAPKGRYYDLTTLFDRLNQEYFENRIEGVTLGWSLRKSRRILGHFDPSHGSITVSRIFDHPETPEMVVSYIMFHEMLHAKFATSSNFDLKHRHSRQFKNEEKKFADYDAANDWLKANL
jgi:Tfp pilus assembly protein PilF